MTLASANFALRRHARQSTLCTDITVDVSERGVVAGCNAVRKKLCSGAQVVAVLLQLQVARLQDPQEHGARFGYTVLPTGSQD